MSKQEFLDKLRAALNGRIAPSLVIDNVNYYEDYINVEIRKGRKEAEVLQMLGDPRLIARTIIETTNKNGQTGYHEEEYQSYQSQSNGYRNADSQQTGYRNDMPPAKRFQIPGWLWAVLIILIVVGILSLVFSVLTFLAPIIIPIIVVMFLVKLFRDWLN